MEPSSPAVFLLLSGWHGIYFTANWNRCPEDISTSMRRPPALSWFLEAQASAGTSGSCCSIQGSPVDGGRGWRDFFEYFYGPFKCKHKTLWSEHTLSAWYRGLYLSRAPPGRTSFSFCPSLQGALGPMCTMETHITPTGAAGNPLLHKPHVRAKYTH